MAGSASCSRCCRHCRRSSSRRPRSYHVETIEPETQELFDCTHQPAHWVWKLLHSQTFAAQEHQQQQQLPSIVLRAGLACCFGGAAAASTEQACAPSCCCCPKRVQAHVVEGRCHMISVVSHRQLQHSACLHKLQQPARANCLWPHVWRARPALLVG